MNLHGDAPVKSTPRAKRPKGVDIDRPEGAGKLLLRRKIRRDLKRNVHPAGCRCSDCGILSPDAVGRVAP